MIEKIAAFDVGDKRIGTAFSDPFGEYALPGETYFRTGNFRQDVEAIAQIAREHGATRIVCGLPFNADGSESIQTEKTRRFVRALAEVAAVPVIFEDERYTTLQARGDLHEMGISSRRDKRKKNVDSLAAAYILESYLSKNKNKSGGDAMIEEKNDYEDDGNIVTLVDDEGVETEFEHLLTFEYKKEWYVALSRIEEPEEETEENEDSGEEVAIFHLVGEDEDETLETIDDDAFLDEVFAEFCKLYEDEEDLAALDGDED